MHVPRSLAPLTLAVAVVAAFGWLWAAGAPYRAIAAGGAPPGTAPLAPAARAAAEPPIAQAVAVGHVLPAQHVRWVQDVPASFTFRVARGEARFDGGARTARVTIDRPGWLEQPPIRPGPLGDSSLVEVADDGDAVAAPPRSVFTADIVGIRRMFDVVDASDPAYLDAGPDHFVIDLDAVRDTRAVTVYGAGARRRSETLGGARGGGLERGDPADVADSGADRSRAGDAGDAGVAGDLAVPTDFAAGLVRPGLGVDTNVRTARGPGVLAWAFDDPNGAGFSIKPDAAASLARPWAAGRGVDGLYRVGWGCCTAIEVPDSCTVIVLGPDAAFEAHCNWAAYLAGRRPMWINTCDRPSWPDCPLP
ncbi:MAG: hypothetical protein ABI780_04245 [Ardenticatenales bacterium]